MDRAACMRWHSAHERRPTAGPGGETREGVSPATPHRARTVIGVRVPTAVRRNGIAIGNGIKC